VYRRRRLAVLLVLLVIIAGVVLAIWHPWTGSAATTPDPTTPASQGPSTSASTSPDASGSATPEASADPAATTPAPTPSGISTGSAIAACSTSEISVLAVTDKDSYGAGELPKLSITLSNTSDAPCLINVGTATQTFKISSGSDVWWRSTDCQSESSDQVVQLAAGQTVSSFEPLVWDRTRSSTTTCDATRPAAASGYYHLQVSIGGIEAADTKMFQLR